MCEFKSAIVLRDEREKGGFRLLLSPWTESHSDIERIFKLKEGKSLKFAKVEFSPPDMRTAWQPETYKLRIDEGRTPDWFDAEMKELVVEKMTAYIKSIIVTGDVDLLIGGQFIVAPECTVSSVQTCVISAIFGNASNVRGSASITNVCGSASITDVRDSASITNVCGSASITDVGDSASIKNVCGSASITNVWGSASITDVWGSASITDVCGSASITDVCGSASITDVRDSASITNVRDSASIKNDNREPKKESK